MGDDELIRRTALGDHGAFHELVERHEAAVLRFLRLLTRQDAEDVLQETFFAVYRSAAQYRGDASFRTWLFRIAKNAAYQARLRRARHGESTAEFPTLIGYDDPEQQAIRGERLRALYCALSALEPEDREVIMLRDLRGVTGEETAHVLGISLAAMKSRLHRARARLAAALALAMSRPYSSADGAGLEWAGPRNTAFRNNTFIPS